MTSTETHHRTSDRTRSLPFDSLSYSNNMESVGFTREQAQMMAREQSKIINDQLATKGDVDAAVHELNARLDVKTSELNAKIDTKVSELNAKIDATKSEILKWMFGSIGSQTIVLLAAILGILRTGVH